VRIRFGTFAVEDAGGRAAGLRANRDRLAGVVEVAIAVAEEGAAAELDHVSIDGDVEGRLDRGKVPAPVRKHDEGVREGVPEGRARQNRRRKPLTENEFGVGKKSMSSHEVAVLPGRMGDIKGSTVRC